MVKGRVRHGLRRLLGRAEEAAPAEDPSLVGLLTGSRFEGLPPQRESLDPRQTRATMEFLLDLGEQMFIAGSETRSIETGLIAVAATFGLGPIELVIAGRTVHLQYAPPGRTPVVMLKVARTEEGRDLGRMHAIYRLVDDITKGRLDRRDASRELDRIRRLAPVWPWWAMLAGSTVLAASISLQAHGTLPGTLAAMAVLVISNRLGWALPRGGIPSYYVTFVQAAVVVGLGVLALEGGLVQGQTAASTTAANLVLLLPTLSIVSLAQDAITGFELTAASRLIRVVLAFVSLSAAVGAVGVLASDSHAIGNTQQAQFVGLPVLLGLLAAAVGSAANGIAMGGVARLIPFASLMGVLAMGVRLTGAGILHLPPPMAVLLAAIVLGTVAGQLSPWLRIPAAALVTPGVTGALLPASSVYRSLSDYTAGAPGAGRGLLSALVTTAAIGAGVVLGNILGAKTEAKVDGKHGPNPKNTPAPQR